MVRHSVVAYRNDRPNHESIDFTGDAWLGYVPIRMANTICVQEKLPPGAAAVLINRSHTYTDIYLPIDAQQKNLYDAIDGKRSIGEIAPETALRKMRACPFRGALALRPGRVRYLAVKLPAVRGKGERTKGGK